MDNRQDGTYTDVSGIYWYSHRLFTYQALVQVLTIAAYVTGFAWALDWGVTGHSLMPLALTWVSLAIAGVVSLLLYRAFGPYPGKQLVPRGIWFALGIVSVWVTSMGLVLHMPDGFAPMAVAGLAGAVAPLVGRGLDSFAMDVIRSEATKKRLRR